MRQYKSYVQSHYEPFYAKTKTTIPSFLVQKFLVQNTTPKSLNYSSVNQCKKTHVALLIKRGKIISQAYNKLASREKGASSRGSQSFIHAEKNLIKNLSNQELLRGSVIYVLRISSSNGGEFSYSQPCPECTVLLHKCMQKFGLRFVYFST